MTPVRDARHDLLAKVATLVEGVGVGKRRFQEERSGIHIYAVADDAGFHPERVPGVAAYRPGARLPESVPEPAEQLRGRPEIVAFLSRLLRANDVHLGSVPGQDDVVPAREIGHRFAERLLHGLAGERTRDGEDPRHRGHVLELGPFREEVAIDPGQERPSQLPVRLEDEAVGQAVDREKRGDLPVDIQQGRLGALPGCETLDVARDEPVEERRTVLPGDLDLPALGPVDQSRALAHRLVLAVRVAARGAV